MSTCLAHTHCHNNPLVRDSPTVEAIFASILLVLGGIWVWWSLACYFVVHGLVGVSAKGMSWILEPIVEDVVRESLQGQIRRPEAFLMSKPTWARTILESRTVRRSFLPSSIDQFFFFTRITTGYHGRVRVTRLLIGSCSSLISQLD
jgi:hypothetical protein